MSSRCALFSAFKSCCFLHCCTFSDKQWPSVFVAQATVFVRTHTTIWNFRLGILGETPKLVLNLPLDNDFSTDYRTSFSLDEAFSNFVLNWDHCPEQMSLTLKILRGSESLCYLSIRTFVDVLIITVICVRETRHAPLAKLLAKRRNVILWSILDFRLSQHHDQHMFASTHASKGLSVEEHQTSDGRQTGAMHLVRGSATLVLEASESPTVCSYWNSDIFALFDSENSHTILLNLSTVIRLESDIRGSLRFLWW